MYVPSVHPLATSSPNSPPDKLTAAQATGKKMFIDKMETFVDRLSVFTTRYELSDDATAKARPRSTPAAARLPL